MLVAVLSTWLKRRRFSAIVRESPALENSLASEPHGIHFAYGSRQRKSPGGSGLHSALGAFHCQSFPQATLRFGYHSSGRPDRRGLAAHRGADRILHGGGAGRAEGEYSA